MAATANPKDIANVQSDQYFRETVESIIVAFILAFLFRAFVAEAFVIPTGSMAPTLMGAHKDLFCNECGVRYQVGASCEYDNSTATPNGRAVVGGTAAVSRAVNPIDFENANEATFSGDRILVSKFDYVFSNPKRWDVLVFKFPGEARMNYIKRLIGLPGEEIRIQEGDIYIRRSDDEQWQIARKPPHKVLAMRQPVTDTKYLSKSLVSMNYPSLWQPWSDSESEASWSIQQDAKGWSAELKANTSPTWLRYFHKQLTEKEWLSVYDGKPVAHSPTASTLVTDYLAYNSFCDNPSQVQMDAAGLVDRFLANTENGMHWVGDLTGDFEVEVKSGTGTLLLQIVEFGIVYQLSIDVQSGEAKLQAFDGNSDKRSVIEGHFNGQSDIVAATKIRGAGKYKVAIGNIDEQILVWINGGLLRFNMPAEFDSRSLRDASNRRPFWNKQDPLDAAPIGIGGLGLDMTVNRAQVFRDLYYVAVAGYRPLPNEFRGNLPIVEQEIRSATKLSDPQVTRFIYSNPEMWANTKLFALRDKQEFQLGDGQYFPMGDNSAQSSDARMWNERFVDEKFLLGKALLVFWPHSWNLPAPGTPNFNRMGLIR
jgi:signal peptidase I